MLRVDCEKEIETWRKRGKEKEKQIKGMAKREKGWRSEREDYRGRVRKRKRQRSCNIHSANQRSKYRSVKLIEANSDYSCVLFLNNN